MKILDNLKSSYWFNFLVICGWIVFCAFWVCIFPLNFGPESGAGDVALIYYLVITAFSFICLLISFFMYIAEPIFSFKIKNEIFLKNFFFQYITSYFTKIKRELL